jgi:glycerol transport system ATP-binding protein
MARIELDGLAHSYSANPRAPRDYALKRMDFVWENGGAYALLGPSGCGKSTLLNIISGLLQPTEGRILFDGQDVTRQSPAGRNIAQVFQFPVVYDTMTVRENLAFPLRNRGMPLDRVTAKVAEVAEILELAPALDRRAANLTADMKQKISLGRGLVRDDVAAILFDEPLTVIDPHLKWLLRRKLKQVHERYRRTLVYVTHDQNEALTFADRVIVMLDGEVLQVGSPQELFENPAHRFVGWFIGSPGMNFLPVEPQDGALVLAGTSIIVPRPHTANGAGDGLELGIRPEFIQLSPESGSDGVPVRVERVEDLGNYKLLSGRVGAHLIKAKLDESRTVSSEEVRLLLPRDRVRLYAGGRLVS